MVIRIKPTSDNFKHLLKGFQKHPVEIEIKMQTESPDAYLTVTFVSKKNWRELTK